MRKKIIAYTPNQIRVKSNRFLLLSFYSNCLYLDSSDDEISNDGLSSDRLVDPSQKVIQMILEF